MTLKKLTTARSYTSSSRTARKRRLSANKQLKCPYNCIVLTKTGRETTETNWNKLRELMKDAEGYDSTAKPKFFFTPLATSLKESLKGVGNDQD